MLVSRLMIRASGACDFDFGQRSPQIYAKSTGFEYETVQLLGKRNIATSVFHVGFVKDGMRRVRQDLVDAPAGHDIPAEKQFDSLRLLVVAILNALLTLVGYLLQDFVG